MTYWWTQTVADIADWFPGGLYLLGLVLLLVAVAIGLITQPAGMFGFSRGKPSRKSKASHAEIVPASSADDAELPELPADALLARAQQYMAAGDYRHAVREWLRVMVRDLVERDVIENHPGWTVTELAMAAGQAMPAVAGALDEAARSFSDVWYGGRDADLPVAARMRDLHATVAAAVAPAGGHASVTRPGVAPA
jgi:hypothetical protein